MGLIISLFISLSIFVVLAAIIVWVADYTTVSRRRATAIDVLNRRTTILDSP